MSIYFIADTFFDSEKFMTKFERKFNNVTEMNEFMINKWNSTVKKSDIVYHIGNVSHGHNSRDRHFWFNILNGRISYCRGCFDVGEFGEKIIYTRGTSHTFLLTNDPKDIYKWQGWIIHGKFNKCFTKYYPFINGIAKTINVSADLIGFAPVSLDYIDSLNIDTIKYMEYYNSLIVRR